MGLLMLKIPSTPSPKFPLMASDVGTHILGYDISETKIEASSTSLFYQTACNLSEAAQFR
jgi:hypothetical protein